MLLPYNVDRPTKRTPYVTYGLIGVNIFVFLMTLVVSNTNLPADQVQAAGEIKSILAADPQSAQLVEAPGAKAGDSSGATGDAPLSAKEQKLFERLQQERALELLAQKPMDTVTYRRVWLVEHAHDTFVLEPHYSTLETFAYRPGDASPLGKIIGMFGSMFLHGGVEHIVGNMFFLWIFGRALEEFLGPKFYLALYLACGVAAVLMFHVVTMTFSPQNAGEPLIGASGAIAGVMGMFIVRFYRTKVRVLYLMPWLLIPGVGGLIVIPLLIAYILLTILIYAVIGNTTASLLLALVAFLVALYFYGRDWAWGAFRAPSMWVIGVWIVLFNLLPAISELVHGESGGVAYWAHVGGFSCGAIYAFFVGGADVGKQEYALEDAQKALATAGATDAMQRAQQLLERQPESPAALEILARSFDSQNQPEQASDAYVKAIRGYWKSNERDAASRLYSMALETNPQLPLDAILLSGLAAHYAKYELWTESAALLVRVIEEHPRSGECEMAILRAGQIWGRHFADPAESARLYQLFLDSYPHSPYAEQTRNALKGAREAAANRPQ